MFDDNQSIYIQIAEMIENNILANLLKPEDQAPSTNEFAQVYAINPATARKGLNLLVDEGILYKKRGLGMFVTEKAKEIIQNKRKSQFLEEKLPDLIQEAQLLGMTQNDILKKIEEVWNDKI